MSRTAATPLVHSQRKNGECYAACRVCQRDYAKTKQVIYQLFGDIIFQNLFGLGFSAAIAAAHQPWEAYQDLVRVYPPQVRELALFLGRKRKEMISHGNVDKKTD